MDKEQQEFLDNISKGDLKTAMDMYQKRVKDIAKRNPMTLEQVTEYALMANAMFAMHEAKLAELTLLLDEAAMTIEMMSERVIELSGEKDKFAVPDIPKGKLN